MKAMMLAKGRCVAVQTCESLRFKKTGAEISKALQGLIDQHNGFIGTATSDITAICERREISADEVLAACEADNREAAFEAYETQALRSVGGGQAATNAVIRELQQDLNHIRELTGAILVSRGEIDEMQRIRNNIEQDRTFDLTHQELLKLGF